MPNRENAMRIAYFISELVRKHTGENIWISDYSYKSAHQFRDFLIENGGIILNLNIYNDFIIVAKGIKLKLFKFKINDSFTIVYCPFYEGSKNIWLFFMDSDVSFDEKLVEQKFIQMIDCFFTEDEKVIEKNMHKYAKILNKVEIKKLKNFILSKEADKKYYEDCVKRIKEDIKTHKERVKKLKSPMNDICINGFKNIIEHKKVEKAKYLTLNNCIIIDTKPLYMTNPNVEGRFYLGKMKIYFNINDYNLRIYNKDNLRRGYWGSECNHPHVDETGKACQGNLSDILAHCKLNNELYVAFLMILSFLETFEPSDIAGSYYTCYDKVDEEGNVIEKGYYEGQHCEICGVEINMEEDDYAHCDICGSFVCYDCSEYIDDSTVCTNCIDDACIECVNCDTLHFSDCMHETYDGGLICEFCRDKYYVECSECGRLVHEDEAVYDSNTESYYCPECKPRRD